MSQIFHHSTNTLSKLSIFGALFLVAGTLWLVLEINRSPYVTQAGIAREQPVPFSHQHHVGGLGIDCRYCHTTVETSSFAGMPATEVCMNCHKQIWSDAPMLEPVRESYRNGRPLHWNRVYDLPGLAYFDHSIHVNKGVGCATCHGRVDEMPLLWRANTLYMKWCLGCHEAPARFVRPREHVFELDWRPDEDEEALGRRLVAEYGIMDREHLTSCYICHR